MLGITYINIIYNKKKALCETGDHLRFYDIRFHDMMLYCIAQHSVLNNEQYSSLKYCIYIYIYIYIYD